MFNNVRERFWLRWNGKESGVISIVITNREMELEMQLLIFNKADLPDDAQILPEYPLQWKTARAMLKLRKDSFKAKLLLKKFPSAGNG